MAMSQCCGMAARISRKVGERRNRFARTLERNGREANHAALADYLAKAQAQGFMGAGDPAVIAAHFLALLWGGLLIQLLLRVRDAPGAQEIEARAHAAMRAVVTLYAPARSAHSL